MLAAAKDGIAFMYGVQFQSFQASFCFCSINVYFFSSLRSHSMFMTNNAGRILLFLSLFLKGCHLFILKQS